MQKIDLNCDMGESFGLYQMGNDEEMMKYISSANIACGYHAGDPEVMRKTVELAKKHNVAIGAHPGLPDLMGFGRRKMDVTISEVKNYITYQMGALREFAKAFQVNLQHCKPHGALYMMAMEDEDIAKAVLEAIAEVDTNIIVSAMNNSAIVEAGEKVGIRVAKEVYADREHTTTGSIIMTRASSNIEDYQAMTDRVLRMVKEGQVIADTGEDVSLTAETVCIHADTPGALQLAQSIRKVFESENIEMVPMKEVLS